MGETGTQTYGDAGGDAFETCLECRRLLAKSEMVFLQKCWICAECKPLFLQRIKEGVGPEGMTGVLWRDGNKVVMRLGTKMPDRCYKCNAPKFGEPVGRPVQWHKPVYAIVLVAGVVIIGVLSGILFPGFFPIGFSILFILTSNFFVKTVQLQLALCRTHKRSRFIANLMTVVLSISLTLVLVLSLNFSWGWVVTCSCVLLILVTLLTGSLFTRVASVSKATDDHVWLKGAGKEFLESLPEWPGSE